MVMPALSLRSSSGSWSKENNENGSIEVVFALLILRVAFNVKSLVDSHVHTEETSSICHTHSYITPSTAIPTPSFIS
jgi:hypothetical protein